MALALSIIIPTLNEEKFLPLLLTSIKNQTQQPAEIIVSDAFSTDKTRQIARSFGAKVVNGGSVAVARNNGAKVATQKLLLFLDADMILPPDFLEISFSELNRKKLDIAPCLVYSLSPSKIDSFLVDTISLYLKLTEKILPHGIGACMFVTRKIHKKIKGFDRSLCLAEDHDYVKRAKKYGKFSYLSNVKAWMSTRRFTKEGRLKLMAKYTICEFHHFFLGPIRKPIYKYEFGNYQDYQDKWS